MFRFILLGCFLGSVISADILAVFPHTGKSHFDVFEPLVLALAARGHRVTVLSFYPQKTVVANYTDISLVGLVPLRLNQVQFNEVESPIPDLISMSRMGLEMCEKILTFRPVRDLLNSEVKFDLIIVELFNTDCFLSLVHKYGVPYLGISSANTSPEQDGRVGTPAELAYVSHPDLPLDSDMSLSQRLWNVAYTVLVRVVRVYFMKQEERTVARVMGEEIPLRGLAREVSLLLANIHHSIVTPRPMVPGHIEVGGIHIHPARPLKEDLDKYLNESAEGAILFSMGSVLQSSSFPPAKRQAIMDAFAELPVRVLMKWEDDTLPGKPDNVRLSKWLPQRDILVHPKILAFMAHGGLLSTSEAVYCGVPMVLIPMFGDQPNNVAHLTATGAAVKLAYDDITKEAVLSALRAVLYDPRYRENAKLLSERFRDRPMSPLDTAVYWTEYVLRHKGARHLRSAAVDMPWYQLWLLDVVLVLLAGLSALLLVVIWLTRRVTSLIVRRLYSQQPRQKTD
uniref:UDP-glucuronosyltransferase n=1 Tax=Graphocephala atropunctata TaxID=36148 RepID=A0A1B6L8F2_9HEMI